MSVVGLSESPGRDAFERVNELGELDGRGELDQQVNVVIFAVELHKGAAKVFAHGGHDLFAVGEDRSCERASPVFRHEHQVRVAVPNGMSSLANVGVSVHDTKHNGGVARKAQPTPGMRATCRKYPVRLDAEQRVRLDGQADAARALWNLLHAYHEFYASARRWPAWGQMDAAIRQARKEVPWLKELPAQAGQQVLKTYRKAWESYWAGTHARPTWKSRRSRRAVDVPQARDLQLTRLNRKWWTVQIPKIGKVKVRVQQPLPQRTTGARLVCDGNGWQLVVRGEDPIAHGCARNPQHALGLDRGVTHTLATSAGEMLDQPATITPGEARRLYRLERKAARQRAARRPGQRTSARLKRTYEQIGVLKSRQARRRYDFAHQATARLVDAGYGTYAIEALRIMNMTASARGTIEQPGVNVAQKSGLNRSILDQGWGQLAALLAYKAERNFADVVKVPAARTSQTCHRCKHWHPEQRESQALFQCQNPACGWAGNADANAARNIRDLAVGRRLEESLLDVEAIAIRRPGKRQNPTAGTLACAA